jgi:DNA polymerase-3 subunit delta'
MTTRRTPTATAPADPARPSPPLLPLHPDALRDLVARITGPRAPHALLIQAPEGSGKLQLARAAVATVLGVPQAAIDAHPDVDIVDTTGRSGMVGIDAVRDAIAAVRLTSGCGGARFVIVAYGCRLTRQAQNALLKTLEEPGERTTILVPTHRLDAVLPTIRSRAAVWTQPTVPMATLVPWLAEAARVGPAQAHAAAALADGVPGRALAFAAPAMLEHRARLLELIRGVARTGRIDRDALEALADAASGKEVVATTLAMADALLARAAQALAGLPPDGTCELERAMVAALPRPHGMAAILAIAERVRDLTAATQRCHLDPRTTWIRIGLAIQHGLRRT